MQLECSTKQLYGDIDFDNYYRRFATREVDLVANDSMEIYVGKLLESYFSRLPQAVSDFCFSADSKNKRSIQAWIEEISKNFNLVPRQIEDLVRIFVHLMHIEKNSQPALPSWAKAAIFLIAVRIKNKKIYQKIGSEKISAQELYNEILSLYSIKDQEGKLPHQQMRIILAFNLRNGDKINDEQTKGIFMSYDRAIHSNEVIHHLSGILSDFNGIGSNSGFEGIYKSLESWKSFID